jgi:hypothetical protein
MCKVDAADYAITKVHVRGSLIFAGKNQSDTQYKNYFAINIDGDDLPYSLPDLDTNKFWTFPNDGGDYALGAPIPIPANGAALAVQLSFRDINNYYLTVTADLEYTAAALLNWQTQVWNRVYKVELAKANDANQAIKLAYDSAMSRYTSRIADLKAQALNDLLQGQSEAYNQELIVRELKRQCLAFIAKEFDSDTSDDALSSLESEGSFPVEAKFSKLVVNENFQWDFQSRQTVIPAPILATARKKGRYIQFLEQAFDWKQMSYIFYPYFWATPPKWSELLRYKDLTDPNMTSFLQAGAAKILLAVTPAYDDAVLHFIATGEPWEGGPSPVIGDQLFIPLYQELRHQEDDLDNAVPEGKPWTFSLPTSLVYLNGSTVPLPDIEPAFP